MVEFALVLPVLLLLIFGIFEFGRMLFVYSAVFTASREAARYGSAAGVVGGVPLYNDCAGIKAAAQKLSFLTGMQEDDIFIQYDSGPGTAILPPSGCPLPADILVTGGCNRILVEVNAEFTPIVPLVNLPATPIRSKSARTILNNLSVKTDVPVCPAPPPGDSHVGDLDASSFYTGATWKASVTVTVHDAFENPVQGVNVVGTWSGETTPITLCATDYSGMCTATSGDIDPLEASIDFTVSNLTHPHHNFSAADNHDPDGDSDGNHITVSRP